MSPAESSRNPQSSNGTPGKKGKQGRIIRQCERIFPGSATALDACIFFYRGCLRRSTPLEIGLRAAGWGGIGQCISPCAGTEIWEDRLHGSWACHPIHMHAPPCHAPHTLSYAGILAKFPTHHRIWTVSSGGEPFVNTCITKRQDYSSGIQVDPGLPTFSRNPPW